MTANAARDVAVSHVLNLSHDLQSVFHGTDHVIETVGHKLHLYIEIGIDGQGIDGHISKLTETLLSARRFLEKPFKTK